VNTRRRLAVLVGCVLVALAVAWYAGSQHPPSSATPAPGSVRLGPEAGEDVAAYLARLPASLPPDGARAPALVQLAAEVTAPDALAAVEGTTPVTAVFRVPLPRVQTALRFVALEPGVPAATAMDSARVRAQRAAAAEALQTGRPGAVAAVEAASLDSADCRCVVALVVDGDRAGLDAIAGRSAVRAVEAGPPGTTDGELALAPLLPEQTVRADPPPDDGPVPAAP
jgi:tRNA(Ile2) C34 agmatinyltransferase TiaS